MSSIDNTMIHRLRCGEKEITLIGTAHVSKESAELVQTVIETEKPDTVCVELCASRYQAIQQKNAWQDMDIIKVIKEKKAFLLLANLMLASFQKRIAAKLDVTPGQEMLSAIQAAEDTGAAVHLADRDIRTTLARVWRFLGLWGKIKLIFQLVLSLGQADEIEADDVERMKQEDMLQSVLSEVGRSLPVI